MDTSEEYIRQCDCPDIQNAKKTQFGYWVSGDGSFYKDRNFDPGILVNGNATGCPIKKSRFIWLPRQDQIQEMCEGSWWGGYCNVIHWVDSKHFPYVIDEMHSGTLLKSMEQLWLSYYMWEKHNKKWNGEKWEKS